MREPLKPLRDRIDAIDSEILRLVSERASLARQIGKLKDSGVYRPDREAQVLRQVCASNPGPLAASTVERLFVEIISACRALEEPLSVAYLGPEGTFSEQAARKRFGAEAAGAPCASIDEVFRCVEAGRASYGVVPVENSSEGAVGRTLDLLLQTPLKACGEVAVPVRHSLLFSGEDLGAVRKVYSHPQSFAQCQQWLASRLPGVERIPAASNGEAARLASVEPGAAAIAGSAAGKAHGVRAFAEGIEDDPRNTTRFLVIGAHDAERSGRDKTSLVMSAPNRPGAVHDLLSPLARHGVSMTRLESRPSRAGLWEYVFYVDVEGHRTDPTLAQALKELGEIAAVLKVLGSYPTASD